MSGAFLKHIQYDPHSFVFAAMSKLSGDPEMDFSTHPVHAPYPEIFDMPAGDYTLLFGFIEKSDEICLQAVLFNEEGTPVKNMSVPIYPMFASMSDAMEMMMHSSYEPDINGAMNEAEVHSEIMKFFDSGKEQDAATNRELQNQFAEFKKFLSAWIKFDDDEHLPLLNNVFIAIEGNASPIIMSDRDKKFKSDFKPEKHSYN